ncbi:MAG: hypothetical protein IJX62_07325 [Clostridia bacterium]|nr:hypothetical protein [Clostridia bacterium]
MNNREDKPQGGEIVIENRFLKWLDNFWYHYKWTVIVVAFFIFVAIVCLAQCSTQPSGDIMLTYVGGYTMNSNERDVLTNTLNGVAPKREGKQESLTAMINSYAVYTQEQLRADFTDENGKLNQFAYEQAEAQTRDNIQAFANYIKTGDCAVYFISPFAYETQNVKALAVPLSELYQQVPANTYDGYAVYLKDTEFYQYYEALHFLPEDTLVVMLQPLVWGASSNKETYDYFLQLYQNIVNFKAP